ncbi:uncharacterized protein LOC100166851 precursor [Acyrthosiphon pisum]|uniref:ACYPI007690 protein n=1 Tax=Acyrthosiphon pisum TaxID=7029 RepID=C4WTE6_ACYPI|nr:uncharacterized protein LOC100166851 precursor [Acyrthosiphon pisum]BAH71166.1 ACYPI007690 [Acyrthosiphon pisum]|eukprot:NP_001156250.1 uncharacterized protein LOC100166851 precursor [Acyrthosiphon pisum]
MAKSLFIIFVSFIFSTSISFGEDACSNYEDKDCVHPNILKNDHFINQWSVHLPGMTKDEAKQLLEDNGFDYLGKIMDGVDLYLVTKKGTQEKHALPNERIIELLKKHEKVHSVAQKHVLENSQDEVTNIINEDNVHFESLDPDTIVLNDGWNNLERIAAFEAAEAEAEAAIAAAASDNSKPADTNKKIEADGGDDGSRKKKQRRKKQDGVSSSDNESPSETMDHEGSLESDLSNEELLVADLSNEGSADEETSDEELSDEDTVEEVSSDETGLDE